MSAKTDEHSEKLSAAMERLHASINRALDIGIKDRDSPNYVGARFAMASALSKLPYGRAVNLTGKIVATLWPPTGEHDRSFAAAFRSIALAYGGNRPETSYTTEERLRGDLPNDVRFSYYVPNDVWTFSRDAKDCPKCRGSGVVRMFPKMTTSFSATPSDAPEVSDVQIVEEECDHIPSGV